MSERVGVIASCFDLFHSGHVLALYDAKENCDRLVVALQSDPTLDRPEKNKPVQNLFERYVQVNACKYVDHIIPLKNKAVCGLHWHKNWQVIPATENLKKGNKLLEKYRNG